MPGHKLITPDNEVVEVDQKDLDAAYNFGLRDAKPNELLDPKTNELVDVGEHIDAGLKHGFQRLSDPDQTFQNSVNKDNKLRAEYENKKIKYEALDGNPALFRANEDPVENAFTAYKAKQNVSDATKLDREADNSNIKAAYQGALRSVGFDYLRPWLNKGEKALSTALGYNPDAIDIFDDDADVLRIKDANPWVGATGDLIGSVGAGALATAGISALSAGTGTIPTFLASAANVASKVSKLSKIVASGATMSALSTHQDAFLRKDYTNIAERVAASAAIGGVTSGLLHGAKNLLSRKGAIEETTAQINKDPAFDLMRLQGKKLPPVIKDFDPYHLGRMKPLSKTPPRAGVILERPPEGASFEPVMVANRKPGEAILPPALDLADEPTGVAIPRPGKIDEFNRLHNREFNWGREITIRPTKGGLDDTMEGNVLPPASTSAHALDDTMEGNILPPASGKSTVTSTSTSKPQTKEHIYEDHSNENIRFIRDAKGNITEYTPDPLSKIRPEVIPNSRLDKLRLVTEDVRQGLIEQPKVAEAIKQDLHREIRDRANRIEQIGAAIDNNSAIAAKSGHLIRDFAEPMPGSARLGSEAVMWARRNFGLATDQLDEIANNGGSAGKGGRSVLSVLKEKLSGIEDTHFTESDVPLKGVVYSVLDQQKRALGEAAQNTKNVYVKGKLQDKYEALRAHLEDPKVWGERLAREQQNVNAAWAEYIGYAKHDALSRLKQMGAETDPDDLFKKLPVVDDKFLFNMLNNVGRAENETAESAYLAYYRSKIADASMRATLWGSKSLRSEAEEMTVLANEVIHGMSTAKGLNTTIASTVPKPKGFLGTISNDLGGIGGIGIGGGIGSLGGAAGGVAGVAGVLTLKAAHQIYKNKQAAKTAEKIRSIFPTIQKALEAEESLAALKLKPLAKFNAKEAMNKSHDYYTPAAAEWVRKLFISPPDSTDDYPEIQPALASFTSSQRSYIEQFSADPTHSETEKKRVVGALYRPMEILDQAYDGNVHLEQLMAIRTVYPDLHRKFVGDILPKIKEQPYPAQLIWHAKLGIPIMPPEKLQQIHSTGAGKTQNNILTPGNQREPRIKL